jgi:phosphohistidine phosphatase
MKRLILMRHAKSDWSAKGASDHDRILNARGRDSATALGDWLRSKGYVPDEVRCSSAARTGETLQRLALPETTEVHFTRALYLAEAEDMLPELKKATGDVVLMLGHNPGIADFASRLLRDPPYDDNFQLYPTGATLVADFDVKDWSDVAWESGEMRVLVVPRDLI